MRTIDISININIFFLGYIDFLIPIQMFVPGNQELDSSVFICLSLMFILLEFHH